MTGARGAEGRFRRSERDQTMRRAVAHTEGERSRPAVHQSERLAVPVIVEGKPIVRAPEPIAEIGPRRGAAQGVVATRPFDHEPLQAILLDPVEPCRRHLFAIRVGPEVDVHDDDAVDDPERAPPRGISRLHARHERARGPLREGSVRFPARGPTGSDSRGRPPGTEHRRSSSYRGCGGVRRPLRVR